jgi:hypothetical protein
MAISEQLKIYRDAERLLQQQLMLMKKFERFYRYTLGERMINLNLDILEGITKANRKSDKEEALIDVANKIVVLRTLFRTCVAQKVITEKQYIPYAMLVDSMGKQCTAWKNSKELGIRS